ncbi:MAG: hypothetical protein HND48_12375 [Chloroflexi bacterium]|nr:hypothetical protein [Chloroflexota bacterium]
MTDSTRIALVQTRWLGSRTAMKAEYDLLIGDAVALGARWVCLPELSLSPYFPVQRDPNGFGVGRIAGHWRIGTVFR